MIKKLLTLAACAVLAMSVSANVLQLNLNEPLGTWNDEQYDTETHTITFTKAWGGAGWGFWGNGDYSAYDEFVIEFEPTTFMVQLFLQYEDVSQNFTAQAMAGETSCSIKLNKEYATKVGQIYIQPEKAGTLTLKAAYFQTKGELQPETVVWEGSKNLGNWDSFLEMSLSKFIDVNEGDKILINLEVAEGKDGGAYKVIWVDPDYNWISLPSMASNPAYNAEGESLWCSQSGYQTITINASDAYNFNNNIGHEIVVLGGDLTVKEVKIVRNIESVTSPVYDNATPTYYNLQGLQISNPEKGQIYIVKSGDKVSKLIMR